MLTMNEKQAQAFRIPLNQRHYYVAVCDPKVNMSRRADTVPWYRLVSVQLNNATETYPDGDSVQAVERWEPSSPWDGMPRATVIRVLERFKKEPVNRETDAPMAGERWTMEKAAKDRWAGHVLCDIAGRNEQEATAILKTWLEYGVITETTDTRPTRSGHEAKCIEVNQSKLDEMRPVAMPEFDDE
jgi:hypothetical protein